MRWRLLLSFIFALIAALFTYWPMSWQPALQLIYGEHIYPALQTLFTRLPNLGRYALMDALWLVLPILFLGRLVWLMRRNLIRRWLSIGLETLLWGSGLYILLMLSWGLNYQRPSLYSHLQQQGFTTKLVNGHWQFALQQSQDTVAKLPSDFDPCNPEPLLLNPNRAAAISHSSYALANLPTSPSRAVVESAWSPLYTRLSVAGVYLPFTGEPSINGQSFEYAKPTISLHEYAHWAGYAREYDADILAYWSAWLAPDPVWQYSGWLVWWHSIETPNSIREQLPATLRLGLQCYQSHLQAQPRWEIRKWAWRAYETNLKTQGVSEGLQSYAMGEAMALTSYQDWLWQKVQ